MLARFQSKTVAGGRLTARSHPHPSPALHISAPSNTITPFPPNHLTCACGLDQEGKTPLLVASQKDRSEVVKALHLAGADVEAKDKVRA